MAVPCADQRDQQPKPDLSGSEHQSDRRLCGASVLRINVYGPVRRLPVCNRIPAGRVLADDCIDQRHIQPVSDLSRAGTDHPGRIWRRSVLHCAVRRYIVRHRSGIRYHISVPCADQRDQQPKPDLSGTVNPHTVGHNNTPGHQLRGTIFNKVLTKLTI